MLSFKANLTELKSFGSPPSAVLMVMGAVMVLVLGAGGKPPKDRLVIIHVRRLYFHAGPGQK
jgi:hypothetical protein